MTRKTGLIRNDWMIVGAIAVCVVGVLLTVFTSVSDWVTLAIAALGFGVAFAFTCAPK